MIQPAQDILRIMHLDPVRHGWAIDHDDRQAQLPRRDQLGLRAPATGILAQQQVDSMFLHQPRVTLRSKRPAINDDAVMGESGRHTRRIDEAEQIMMLRLGGKGLHMHSAQRQHDAARGTSQRGHGGVHICHMVPSVTSGGFPWRAGEGDMRNARRLRRPHGVRAYRRGEGMGGIDQMGEALLADIACQSIHPAKAADAHRHRLGTGMLSSTRIAERRPHAARGEQPGQRARFGGAAQKEDIRHG